MVPPAPVPPVPPSTATATARVERVRHVWPVAGAFVAIGLFVGSWEVSSPELNDALGGPARYGLVLSLGLVLGGAANAVGGGLVERLGSSQVLAAALSVWAAVLAVGSVAPAPWGLSVVLVATFGAMGMVDLAANVTGTAAFADRPGRLVRLHASFNLGGVAGCLLVGAALGALGPGGWRWVWPVVAALAASLAVASRRVDLPADGAGAHVRVVDGLRSLHDERLVRVAVAFAMGAVAEGGVGTWGVLHLRRQLDAGLLLGAGGAVAGFAVATLVRLTVGGVQTRRGARRALVAGSLTSAAGALTLALVPVPWLAAVGLVAAAGGVAVTWPLLLSEIGEGRDRPGVLVGATTTLGYVGLVGGPVLLGGLVAAWGTGPALVLVAGVVASVGPCALWRRPLADRT